MNAVAIAPMLDILLVDDDSEVLAQCLRLLPKEVDGHRVYWEACESFEAATELLRRRRYDMVFTDVYRDRSGQRKGLSDADNAARGIVDDIRRLRFCPVVLFSDGPSPNDILNEPFVRFVDKAHHHFDVALSDELRRFIGTGIVQVVRKLHAELDRAAGSYIWEFIGRRWDELFAIPGFNTDVLSRLVRRRASTQLSRLQEDANLDRDSSDAFDYYTYPTPDGPLLLGEILLSRQTGDFYVVLTPHCYFVPHGVQEKATPPKADFVLLALCVRAATLLTGEKSPNRAGSVRIPATVGKPVGRYCYLPAFLDVPDLYCDLLQLSSLPIGAVQAGYSRIAVIDPPFAEAIQASMTKLYSSVGLRDLRPEDFGRLFDQKPKAAG